MTEPPHPTPALRAQPLDHEERPLRNAFVPILLVALSVSAWFGFQTLQLVREQQQLEAAKVSLAPQELAATKLRSRARPGRHGHGQAGGRRKRQRALDPRAAPQPGRDDQFAAAASAAR